MTAVLLRGEKDTKRRIGKVTEAETRVMWPSAKSTEDCEQPAQASREAWDRLFLRVPEGTNLINILILDFWPLEQKPNKFLPFEATQYVGFGNAALENTLSGLLTLSTADIGAGSVLCWEVGRKILCRVLSSTPGFSPLC